MMEGENAPKYGSLFLEILAINHSVSWSCYRKSINCIGGISKRVRRCAVFKKIEQLQQIALCTPKKLID